MSFLPDNYKLKSDRFENLKKSFCKKPSEYFGRFITQLTGEEPDWSDADYGEPPYNYDK
jgi:hypothetical protein